MPGLGEFRIPTRHVPALRWLAELDQADFERMRPSLAGLRGAAEAPESLAKRAAVEGAKWSDNLATDLLSALFSLQALADTHSWAVTALAQRAWEMLKLEPPTAADLETRIVGLLSIRSVRTAAKASDLAGNVEQLFHVARFVTDVRPIFGDDPTETPVGAIVMHTLRLDYYGASGRLASSYITLNDEDLLMLGRGVERALQKGRKLRALLKEANLESLVAGGGDND